MHIRQQVLYLLLIQRLSEPRHLAATEANDLSNTLVVGGNSTLRKKGLLEDTFQPRSLLSAGRVGFVTLIAVAVIHATSGALLRIQSQLGVRLPDFGVTAQ
jgi:hypothetical protein